MQSITIYIHCGNFHHVVIQVIEKIGHFHHGVIQVIEKIGNFHHGVIQVIEKRGHFHKFLCKIINPKLVDLTIITHLMQIAAKEKGLS